MTSLPRVVTGRRRQHQLLRSWQVWALTSILLDPAEVAHVRESGWAGTHHRDIDTGERIVGTPGGLGFGVDASWHNPREVIPWSQIEEIARTVPADVRGQLVDFRARWRAHQSAYPRFTASAAAVGCGPIVPGHALTARQEAYVREHQAFQDSGALSAWEQNKSMLEAERRALHDRALGSGSLEQDAADLLELLEDQQVVPALTSPPQVDDVLDEETGPAVQRPGLFPPISRPRRADELSQATATGAPGTEVDR